MKKQYESPEFALVAFFDCNDVIRTSGVPDLEENEKGVFDDEIFG